MEGKPPNALATIAQWPGANKNKLTMHQVNWISVHAELPEDGVLVWTGHYRTKSSQLGYYRKRYNAFFDIAGSGLAISHWAKIVLPTAPEKEGFINPLL